MGTWIVWLGLFVGMENSSAFPAPLQQPGLTMTTAALVGVKDTTIRVGYILPLQKNGYGPALQIGFSKKLF